MAASNSGSTFDAGSVERVLDEFRNTNTAVEALFRVHVGTTSASTLNRSTVEDALRTLNSRVALAIQRGQGHTEYLYYRNDEDSEGWYSITETAATSVGPIALYDHNVEDRLNEDHDVLVARTGATPYADVDLAPHGLDPDEDGVVLDG